MPGIGQILPFRRRAGAAPPACQNYFQDLFVGGDAATLGSNWTEDAGGALQVKDGDAALLDSGGTDMSGYGTCVHDMCSADQTVGTSWWSGNDEATGTGNWRAMLYLRARCDVADGDLADIGSCYYTAIRSDGLGGGAVTHWKKIGENYTNLGNIIWSGDLKGDMTFQVASAGTWRQRTSSVQMDQIALETLDTDINSGAYAGCGLRLMDNTGTVTGGRTTIADYTQYDGTYTP